MRPRVIPVLLLDNGGLVKTVRFEKPAYIGDPINAVRLFNDMEVDELVLLDIGASRGGRGPDFKAIKEIAEEAFMPLCYGGGVRSVDDFARLFDLGLEKVCVDQAARRFPPLVSDASEKFGSQSVVVCLSVRSGWLAGAKVFDYIGKKKLGDPLWHARDMEEAGAGELLLNFVTLDGTMKGMDLSTIRAVSQNVSVPIVACGGAGSLEDLVEAANAGADAVAAGSLFVYQGYTRGILINYPSQIELNRVFGMPAELSHV